ncbi:MAG TPA: MarR family transcriptional regulator [Thermoanaerobaculia bacterium]|nr:MarR family transcriptional regulator [Thermoanaerobaculia bacterium]
MSEAPPAAGLSPMRKAILGIVKRGGSAAVGELAAELAVSYEAVRQQVRQLHREGWIERRVARDVSRVGRPEARYRLTPAADHLFPKHYDALSVELLDAVGERFGQGGVRAILADLTDARVREWEPRLQGMDLEERLAALQGIYLDGDPFVSVERGADGALRLVERNCPFLSVAEKRPALCSITVSALTRLLRRRVVRERTFQAGDGCCAFRVLDQKPVDADRYRFELEPAPGA